MLRINVRNGSPRRPSIRLALGAVPLVLLSMMLSPVKAATDADVDRMTTYAVVMGRAKGCGLDLTEAITRVTPWLDQTFPSTSDENKALLAVFSAGMNYSERMQLSGKTADSCTAVRRAYVGFPWPCSPILPGNKQLCERAQGRK